MTSKQKSKPTNLRAVLEFRSGPHASEAIRLRRDATIFGREKGDVIVDDNEVSSTHCQIQCIDDTYHIFDMNSTNGTFVNSEKILKSKLTDGDTIKIGTTTFRFSIYEERDIRHISTVFKTKKTHNASTSSIVDTLIESELQGPKSHAIQLQIKYADHKVEDVTLRQRIVYVGRASSFGKFDQDSEISRRHLMIKLNDSGEIFIEDQGSTNGTYLNGKKIQGMHLITDTDTVRVGGTELHIFAKLND